MDLAKLKTEVDRAVESCIEYGDSPKDVTVSVQIDDQNGKGRYSTDVELHYDNDCQASGCVLVGTAE